MSEEKKRKQPYRSKKAPHALLLNYFPRSTETLTKIKNCTLEILRVLMTEVTQHGIEYFSIGFDVE